MRAAEQPVAEPAPPLRLRGARLLGRERPVDIAMANGVITSITDADSPLSARSAAFGQDEARESIDLDGRFVIPGLWDQHVHLTQWALTSGRFDVSAAESAAHAAAMVAETIRTGRHGEDSGPLIGYGFRDGLWPDEPTAALLDEAGGGTSVVLVSADIHCVWVNTSAAAHFGVSVDASGLLLEDAAFAVEGELDKAPDALVDRWVREAGQRAAKRGVVGLVDLEMTWNADIWRRRRAGGFDTQRVRFGVYPQDLERAIGEGLRTGDRLDDLLEVGYLKVLIDGSLNTRTAYCFDPYPDASSDRFGMLTVEPAELESLLIRSREGGLVPTVHAIGDRAVGITLDVFERVGGGGRMEHAQLVADSDLPRFAALDVVASVQPAHLLDDHDVADHHWSGRTDRAFPLRSFLDSGARLAFGSDAPVAPLDPWVTMAAAVNRAHPGGSPWHPEQAVTVDEAIAASIDGRRGIETGGPADLVVLDADPREAGDRLAETAVAATLLAGAFTHRDL